MTSGDSTSRSKRSSWSPSVSQESKENQAGVGILFVEEEDPSGFVRVTVKALIEGGSAEKTGLVKAGDMVVRVGNQDVIGKPLSILRTMIPGPIGSYCKLGFLRGGVALNSNAVQEKSTYYDVQLVRQPTKNEKRKLVSGEVSAADSLNSENSSTSNQSSYPQNKSLPAASQSLDSKQVAASRASLPASATGPGQWTTLSLKTSPPVLWTAENDAGNTNRQKAWSPSSQGSPPSTKQRERADPSSAPTVMSPNSSALSSAVEAAMSNVDKALYDMQNREIERLRAKLESSEREIVRCKDELAKEELRRKDSDERFQMLEKKSRTAITTAYQVNSASVDQRPELALLQQQLEAAKQEKQIETYKRIELENNLKLMERTLLALQNSQKEGSVDARTAQLEQRIAQSEERRRDEEKKRAILEGKVRHLENVAKQQSPFKFQNLMKGRKGPPPHMPDIAEGREENIPANHPNGVPGISRSPTLGAIDGPVPAALAKWGNEGVYMQMQGLQSGMMGVQQNGMPDLYSSQNAIPVMPNSAYPPLNPKLAMHSHGAAQPQGIPGQLSSLGMRSGVQSGMQPQQRGQGIQQMGMPPQGVQQGGLQQGGSVPQVAYKQGSYGKVNTARMPQPLMQGMQMQQLQQDNMKSPPPQQAQRPQQGMVSSDGQYYVSNGMTQQQMLLWQQQQQQQQSGNFPQQLHR